MEILCFTVLFLVVYISVFYFHEAGHYYAAKLMKCKVVKMNFTTELMIPVPNSVYIDDEEVESSRPKTFFHLISGVITGLIPIMAMYSVTDDSGKSATLFFLFAYLVQGCSSDFMQITRVLLGRKPL